MLKRARRNAEQRAAELSDRHEQLATGHAVSLDNVQGQRIRAQQAHRRAEEAHRAAAECSLVDTLTAR